MRKKAENGYIARVDGIDHVFAETLDEAKAALAGQLDSGKDLQIQSYPARGSLREWNYDRSIGQWVEQPESRPAA